MIQILHIFLAILGLGFLVFIHELGHYFVAIKTGMKVEAFGIGFGKPIFTWERKGVKWHICMLPFGGYVRIAGMQKEGALEPSEIPDGFFGKSPWKRIQVALAGPVVNIAFAFIVFVGLWMLGGMNQPYSEHTRRIGWIDPQSALYLQGVRPGDVIEKYDGRDFGGLKDLMIASVMQGKETRIEGYTIDYDSGDKTQFDYTLKKYSDPLQKKEKLQTIGVKAPAQYLIFDEKSSPKGSPIIESGIQSGDRLLWADGEILFSYPQLTTIVNGSTAFLTVQRGDQIFQTKVPRVHIDDLKMSSYERAEIDDWQHETGIKGRLQDLSFVPYTLSPDCLVESRLNFIVKEDQIRSFEQCERCALFNPLQEGDRILAVDGLSVKNSYDLLERLQKRHVLLIVERDPAIASSVDWQEADRQFDQLNLSDLHAVVGAIGTNQSIPSAGNLVLLSPIEPRSYADMAISSEEKSALAKQNEQQIRQVEEIKDPQQKIETLEQLELQQRRLVLGANLHDRQVAYNPNPIQQFSEVMGDTWRTMASLFTGQLNAKYMSGPVGIVQVVQNSWSYGFKAVLFWMAVISLNLGVANLLPLPVLDGGHILFSCIEMVTKKPIPSKTMERLIIPFVGLLIALFIFITFHDISRLFGFTF